MPALPPMAPDLGFQQVQDLARRDGILARIAPSVQSTAPIVQEPVIEPVDVPQVRKPGILAQLGSGIGKALQDPATQRALMAWGSELLSGGGFGRAYQAGQMANDSYNLMRLREQQQELAAAEAGRKAMRDDALLGLEERKVGVLEGRLGLDRDQAESLARFREMQGRAALINATSLAKHRQDLISQGYSRIEADREVANLRSATALAVARIGASKESGRSIPPSQATGILAQVLPPDVVEMARLTPGMIPELMDAATGGYINGGFVGADEAVRGILDQYRPVGKGNPFVTNRFERTEPRQSGQQPVEIANDADYAKLPSGTVFKGPDGVVRVKP
jgi:hypothetical protein